MTKLVVVFSQVAIHSLCSLRRVIRIVAVKSRHVRNGGDEGGGWCEREFREEES